MLAAAGLAGCHGAGSRPAAPSQRLDIPVRPKASAAPPTASDAPSSTPADAAPPEGAPQLPTTLPERAAREPSCNAELCVLDHWLPEPGYAFTPREKLPSPLALWVHRLRQQGVLELPPHAELELVVVELSGTVDYQGMAPDERAKPETHELAPWFALRAPGAGLRVRCKSETCRTLLVVLAPGTTLDSALGGDTQTSRGEQRPGPIEVRAFADAPVYSWNQGKNQARIAFGGTPSAASGKRDEPAPFSLALLEATAQVSIPSHTHERAWETLLVLEGDGYLELRGRSYPLKGGEVIQIPPGTRHGYSASGKRPLRALQLYTPSGPERRFIDAAGQNPTPDSGQAPPSEAR